MVPWYLHVVKRQVGFWNCSRQFFRLSLFMRCSSSFLHCTRPLVFHFIILSDRFEWFISSLDLFVSSFKNFNRMCKRNILSDWICKMLPYFLYWSIFFFLWTFFYRILISNTLFPVYSVSFSTIHIFCLWLCKI